MTQKCAICGYQTDYPQNFTRHMKSHAKRGEFIPISADIKPKSNDIELKSQSIDNQLKSSIYDSKEDSLQSDDKTINDVIANSDKANSITKIDARMKDHVKSKKNEKMPKSSKLTIVKADISQGKARDFKVNNSPDTSKSKGLKDWHIALLVFSLFFTAIAIGFLYNTYVKGKQHSS